MKQIALFGGSFNPPHHGHFEMAKYIYETLNVDEVWFLFSENWQKDLAQYESIEHRMAMGHILAEQYPDYPFVMSDVQHRLQTDITYDVLCHLREQHADKQFTWVMGADSLSNFHTWDDYGEVLQNFHVAVVDRPGFTQQALASPTALQYSFLKASSPRDLKGRKAGWCFLNNPLIDESSSGILKQLRAGEDTFDTRFQAIADYIKKHNLYSVHAENSPALENKKN